MTPLRVVVFGATGTAGTQVVRRCLADPRVAQVRAVTRRELGRAHRKLREVRVTDFATLSDIGDALADVDACFYCLGVSARKVPDEHEYRRITVDYPVAAARALRQRSPRHTFNFLSGAGTDPTGRSRMMWARVKGEAENELRALGLARLLCFRPGHIYADAPSAVGRLPYPVLRWILPGQVIHATELAMAMIEATMSSAPGGVLNNTRIRTLAGRSRRTTHRAAPEVTPPEGWNSS